MANTTDALQNAQARGRQFRRFILVALALHIPLFIYPVLRLGDWLAWPVWLTILILVPVASSQFVSRYLLRQHGNRVAMFFRQVSDLILGVSPVLLMSLLVFELLVLIINVPVEQAAWGVVTLTFLAGLIGSAVAMTPMVVKFQLSSPRLKAPVRFMQITDVHMGSRNKGFLDKVIYRINREKPDFLCITGDFIDATGVPESDLVALKSVIGPIYYCIGNHEKYEDFEDIMQRLKNLGVQVLRDEAMMHRDDIQVIGIDDMEDPLQVEKQLKHIELNNDAFKILLYHRPRGLEAACDHQIELTLSGHTHNGQIFPFNLIVSRVFKRIKGMYQLGGSRQYVSQGTGTWGPVMRLGTLSEITLFEYEPQE